MANAIENAFTAYHPDWAGCAECSLAVPVLSGLFGGYGTFATHMRDVFETRGVKLTFEKDADAHYEKSSNTINLPHTGKADDVGDLVDGLIFESFNAIRRDDFMAASGMSDRYDLVGNGVMTATIEAGTMADFHQLAVAFSGKDRTANMNRCIIRAKEATGSIMAHFLASPHVTDPEKAKTLDPGDERRLPTGYMYIYQNIVNAGPLQMRCVFQTLANVPFVKEQLYTAPVQGRKQIPTTQEVRITTTAEPLKSAAESLDALVKKNWPPASGKKNRPAALLHLIGAVQTDAAYVALRATITKTAFRITGAMENLAAINGPNFVLKAL